MHVQKQNFFPFNDAKLIELFCITLVSIRLK